MNNNPTPYPLAWPTGWPRTRAGDRERSRFRNARAVDDQLSMSDATSRLIRECRLLGAANVIVSTNVAVRRDGLPYARQRTPEDPARSKPPPASRRTMLTPLFDCRPPRGADAPSAPAGATPKKRSR